MFYTVTFNPCIDYIVKVGELCLGETNRSVAEEIQFGGKGINVSCVLKELGVDSVALGFAAGFTGEALLKRLGDIGLENDFIRLDRGDTRINIKLKSDKETEINASGPEIPEDSLKELLSRLEVLNDGDTLILSGSVPPSVPEDIYGTIASKVCPKGVRLVVDAAGELLLNTLKYRPFLIKPNLRELEQLVSRSVDSEDGIVKAAQELQKKGARNVLVSLGGDGALLLGENGDVFREKALGGRPKNTVGAGDSMLAGFLAGVCEGNACALRLGLAAGGATACSETLATRDEIMSLFKTH